ncbi:hypothetical protein AA101099_0017 [Neoasaia chiangmaiensis NBRC 101099]|nr:hypothetical protein AA101099_0017 [Neoasaia chiangmaiensis NBRC 101099]GEN16335.1 hypothetical protein NCH01_27660 [Neoasaia chiangmaiensis]
MLPDVPDDWLEHARKCSEALAARRAAEKKRDEDINLAINGKPAPGPSSRGPGMG